MMNKMMKKVAIVIAAATMAMAGSTVVAHANDGMGIEAVTPNVTVQDMNAEKFVVAVSGANVRTAPSTDAKIVNVIGFNEKVEVLGKTSNGWYQVWTRDSLGGEGTYYISGDLLSDNKQAVNRQESRQEVRNVVKGQTYTTHVEKGYLALRNKPSYDDNNEFGQLWNGSTVIVTDNQCGDYVLVTVTHCAKGEYSANVEGRVGYVNANYLK